MTDKPPPFLLHPHQAAMLEAVRTGTGAFTIGIDPGAPEGDLTAIFVTSTVRPFREDLPLAERVDGIPFFLCPRCGAKSFNPNDIQHRYCGRCKVFVDDEIARDLAEGGVPLVERLDGVVEETAEMKRRAWDMLIAAPPGLALPHLPEAIRLQAIRETLSDEWWAAYHCEQARQAVDRHDRSVLEKAQAVPAYQVHRAASLGTLLAFRADATYRPGRLTLEEHARWNDAARQTRWSAALIYKPRGGFKPSPVRWIFLTWSESEPRRSRMRGVPAPHTFGWAG